MVRRSVSLYILALACCALWAAGCSKDPAVAKVEFLKSGDDYVAQGKLNEAAIQYRSAVNLDPRFGDARYKLAETLAKLGDARGAYQEYIRAADLLPESVDAQLKAGMMSLMAGRFDEARTRADNVLALNATNVDGLILLGNAFAGLKNFDSAVAAVEAAIKADPERGLTYANLGAVQLVQGNPEKAEQSFKQAVSLSPKSIPARQALASFYAANGKADLAEQALKDALAVEPANVAVNKALAYFYMASGRGREAEAPLKRLVDETKDQNARLALAELYRATDRAPLAIELLDGLAGDPAMLAVARSRKAAILYTDGRKEEAYAAVQEVLNKDPKSAVALLQKSALLAADRDLDQALTLAKAAVAGAPEMVGAWFAIGRLHVARGEPDEAVTAYKETLKLAPKFVQVMVELSRVSLQLGKPDDALDFAASALSAQPRNPEATMLKARAFMAKGDPLAAEAPMKQLAADFPKLPIVQAQVGTLYAQKRDFPAARAAYEQALAGDPVNFEALSGLTMLDFAEKKGERARARIDAALVQRRDNPPLLLLAARASLSLGDRAQAERHARRVIEVDPSNVAAYTLLGQIYTSTGRLDEAVAQFEAAAQRRPKAIQFPTLIGMLLEAQNKRAEAAKQYELALSIDSRAAVAANNLAWFHLDTGGSLDVALQLAQTAKAQLPDMPEVSDTLGWIYLKKGLSSLAMAPLLQAASQQPANPVFQYHLGMAYLGEGNLDKANASLQKALSLNPNFDGAADARAALARLKG